MRGKAWLLSWEVAAQWASRDEKDVAERDTHLEENRVLGEWGLGPAVGWGPGGL